MPKLDYITIKGFKSIASMEKLELRPINIVIGPNGSGKSNFIGVFAFLNAIRDGKLKDYVAKAGNADKILHFGSKVTPKMELNLSFEEEKNQYSLELEATPKGELYRSGESVYFWGDKQAYPRPYEIAVTGRDNLREAGISDPKASGIAGYVRDDLASWRLYHLHDTGPSSPLKKPAPIEDNEYLRGDGSNLAAFLYALRESTPEYYSRILSACKLVVPALRDFILEPDRASSGQKIMLNWRGPDPDYVFGPHQFSDGALRAIAILTLLLQPTKDLPPMIVLDEPELGLHPYAIALIAAQLRAVSSERQVIVATQSPPLVDLFEEKDIVVVEQYENTTSFSRLNEGELSEWMEDFSLGQLLEKNVIGGGL